MSGLKWCSECF